MYVARAKSWIKYNLDRSISWTSPQRVSGTCKVGHRCGASDMTKWGKYPLFPQMLREVRIQNLRKKAGNLFAHV